MKDQNVNAQLNYLADSVEPSLYRNGKVFTYRDRDGNDGDYHGVVIEQREVVINDGRGTDESRRRTLEAHGFELLHRPLRDPELQFFKHLRVVQDYYPECTNIVKQATGAECVYAFDHNVRRASDEDNRQRIAGGQQVQGPIHVVHGDYTLVSAPQRMRDLTNPPGTNDTLRSVLPEGESLLSTDFVSRTLDEGRRFAFINVWRNIDHRPVMSHPLALCNGQAVAPGDLVVFELRYDDRTGENYFARYSPEHEWWYYPRITRDEVILIKQWDSAGGLAQSEGRERDSAGGNGNAPCTFSFHTAFTDPDTPADAPARQSIEVRCIAVFD